LIILHRNHPFRLHCDRRTTEQSVYVIFFPQILITIFLILQFCLTVLIMMNLGIDDEFVNLGNTKDFENIQYLSRDENI